MSVIASKFTKNHAQNDLLVAKFVKTNFTLSAPRGQSGQKAAAKYLTRVWIVEANLIKIFLKK